MRIPREHPQEGNLAESGRRDAFFVLVEPGFLQGHNLSSRSLPRSVNFACAPLSSSYYTILVGYWFAYASNINRLETEFSSYKLRYGFMLFFREKGAELAAARDNEQDKVLEESLKEAEKEVLLVSAERDKALQDLKDSLAYHEREGDPELSNYC
nr:protein GRIP isoform X1 [Ipomoea trifida]